MRSGVNWMRELEVERARHDRDQQRLREAGHADQQAVAAGEERDERLLHHGLLPHDHLAQLGRDAAAGRVQAVRQLRIVQSLQRAFRYRDSHEDSPVEFPNAPSSPISHLPSGAR
jgi:hypothetical protein